MKTKQTSNSPVRSRIRALTVIEMTVVLAIMMMLATVVVYSAAGIDEWKKGREAGMDLQSVYLAQKNFLADHPTTAVASIADTDLLPYMQGVTAMPTIESLEGDTLSINFNVMPPIADGGSGSPYDPSDSSSDGLWDVGSH